MHYNKIGYTTNKIIRNFYSRQKFLTPQIRVSLTITVDSKSVYSIPSTLVKVDRFGTNYTIAGNMSFMNASRNIITLTIVDDFDKNPNIGYVVSNSSSLNFTAQPGLPSPFAAKEAINQKIANGNSDCHCRRVYRQSARKKCGNKM